MYTQSDAECSLWFATALLPSGWSTSVRIGIRAGRIITVESGVPAKPGDERYAIGLPGAVNVHSHAFQRALAGLTEHSRGADSFWSWREAMYALVAKLTPEQLEAVAAQAYVEMLEAGITRVGEFHYVHHSADGSHYSNIAEQAVRIAAAASETGIGLTLLPVFYAHGGIGGQPPLPTQRRFVNTLDSYARLLEGSRLALANVPHSQIGIAAHSVRAVKPAELAALRRIEPALPFHMHIAEQIAEVEQWQQWAGARPVEWLLDRFDVDEHWCLVHATHVTEQELSRIVASGAVVGLCPITEANLGDGLFPAKELIARGGHFGIGTDSNVLIDFAEELRLLEYGQRIRHFERNVIRSDDMSTGRTLFQRAVESGAKVLHRDVGRLASGAIADVVALRDDHPTMPHRADDALLDSWIFAGARAIEAVWSGGRKVVSEGQHVQRERIASAYRRTLGDLLS
ncbi:MAG TPA: formimidoylglutamate deiminase [Steroidobacteraceae bacterium]